ncbi:hypothetical protein RBH26_12910 [Natronolimnohabitans sp. A-GB9]|uniref:DUF7266 family protein n=1 Tax=Natronolimnohabitans sp. A-GB9 TaxID=3069757 RepID=UPI0027B3AD74|nr:hypothetical protein [Natronolimnohabitans sp. A-GB9]MDQ2051376.1 hypothetical protein [Natronolimnohabitans sp. A-GB9]
MLHKDTRADSDRGLSVALTHVLTIGITTILIAMLLVSGSAMLDSETERSTQTALETVGERLAGEIDNVDRIADEDGDDETVTLVAEHPQTVANSGYTVELQPESDCDGPLIDESSPCLELSAHDTDVTVYVPVRIDADVSDDQNPVSGGTIEIEYIDDGDDGTIELTEADR